MTGLTFHVTQGYTFKSLETYILFEKQLCPETSLVTKRFY